MPGSSRATAPRRARGPAAACGVLGWLGFCFLAGNPHTRLSRSAVDCVQRRVTLRHSPLAPEHGHPAQPSPGGSAGVCRRLGSPGTRWTAPAPQTSASTVCFHTAPGAGHQKVQEVPELRAALQGRAESQGTRRCGRTLPGLGGERELRVLAVHCASEPWFLNLPHLKITTSAIAFSSLGSLSIFTLKGKTSGPEVAVLYLGSRWHLPSCSDFGNTGWGHTHELGVTQSPRRAYSLCER